MRKWKKERRNN